MTSPSLSVFHAGGVYALFENTVFLCFSFKGLVTDSFPVSKSTCKVSRPAKLSESSSGATKLC